MHICPRSAALSDVLWALKYDIIIIFCTRVISLIPRVKIYYYKYFRVTQGTDMLIFIVCASNSTLCSSGCCDKIRNILNECLYNIVGLYMQNMCIVVDSILYAQCIVLCSNIGLYQSLL